MKIVYRFFLHYLRQIPNYKKIKVLDFGCGNGEVVGLLREGNIDCFGVDIFNKDIYIPVLEDSLFTSGIIKKIEEGAKLPFPEKYFDVIISNQVLEHVRDLTSTIADLGRVLKDDGVMYHQFLCRDVIFEWHSGIPFLHWLPQGSDFRYYYTFFLSILGLGYHKDIFKSPKEWTIKKLCYLDNQCFYRSFKDVCKIFKVNYRFCLRGIRYVSFRSQKNNFLRLLLKIRSLYGFYEYLFRRVSFTAIEMRKF